MWMSGPRVQILLMTPLMLTFALHDYLKRSGTPRLEGLSPSLKLAIQKDSPFSAVLVWD
jgi:hypothetical protein